MLATKPAAVSVTRHAEEVMSSVTVTIHALSSVTAAQIIQMCALVVFKDHVPMLVTRLAARVEIVLGYPPIASVTSHAGPVVIAASI